ncbi:hypothetical protein E5288_WYG007015 [Bos mutus]|uniref:Uncharacterized protein n=1 Tax=Bos mutus TaxID=72004 RepID=A0A6B0QWM5_9CETA|nr:hypothetical protein [Bos mutus]
MAALSCLDSLFNFTHSSVLQLHDTEPMSVFDSYGEKKTEILILSSQYLISEPWSPTSFEDQHKYIESMLCYVKETADQREGRFICGKWYPGDSFFSRPKFGILIPRNDSSKCHDPQGRRTVQSKEMTYVYTLRTLEVQGTEQSGLQPMQSTMQSHAPCCYTPGGICFQEQLSALWPLASVHPSGTNGTLLEENKETYAVRNGYLNFSRHSTDVSLPQSQSIGTPHLRTLIFVITYEGILTNLGSLSFSQDSINGKLSKSEE